MEATNGLAQRRFFYAARVVSVYDGDTVTLDIDLGFRVWLFAQTVRLLGIDCAEIKGGTAQSKLAAAAARDWLSGVALHRSVYLDSAGRDAFGRWLGVLYAEDGLCLNEELLRLGLAVPYKA